jgi:hypothetical protein
MHYASVDVQKHQKKKVANGIALNKDASDDSGRGADTVLNRSSGYR